jgi:hypothetical protein
VRLRTWAEVCIVAWLVVALAASHDVRRMQEKEVRRYVMAVCSDGMPPPDFHQEALDHTFHGLLGPEILESCALARRNFEVALEEGRQKQGMHWESQQKEASWR